MHSLLYIRCAKIKAYHISILLQLLFNHQKWPKHLCKTQLSWRRAKQQHLCAHWSFRPAWASAQSDQSLLCALWVALDPTYLPTDSEDWSDLADAQADVILHWVQMSFLIVTLFNVKLFPLWKPTKWYVRPAKTQISLIRVFAMCSMDS